MVDDVQDSDKISSQDNRYSLLLNKSASFSGSLVSEKIHVQQLFRSKEGDTIVRHYSTEKVHDRQKPSQKHQQFLKDHKIKKIKKFKPKEVIDSLRSEGSRETKENDVNFGSEKFNFVKHCPEEIDFGKFLINNKISETGSTPMEIDTSEEIDKSMSDVHFRNTDMGMNDNKHKNKVPKLLIKQGYQNVFQHNNNRKTPRTIRSTITNIIKIFCLLFIPVAVSVLFIFFNNQSNCCEFLEIDQIENELQGSLFGQDHIVTQITNGLNVMDRKKIFVFTGGIGVGKTLSAQIIANHFPWKDNIQKLIANTYFQNADFESDIVRQLSPDGYNLIIIDGLEVEDRFILLPLLQRLLQTNNKMLIILIFSLQELSEDMIHNVDLHQKSTELSETLMNSGINHFLFKFNNLSEDDVRQCIRNALIKRDLDYNEDVVTEVLENINFKYSGCKGVYSKVALLKH